MITATPGRATEPAERAGLVGLGVLAGVALVTGIAVVMGGGPALVVALGALLALVALASTDVAVAAFVFALYLNLPTVASELHGVPQSASQLVVLLLAVPLVRDVGLRREPVPLTPTHLWVLAYAAAMLLAAAWSFNPGDSVEALRGFVLEGLLLFVLVTSTVRTTSTLRRVTWALLAAVVVMAGLSVLQQVTRAYDDDFGGLAQITTRGVLIDEGIVADTFQPRLAGPIGEKNRYAQVLLVSLPLAVALAAGATRRRARLAALAAAALALAAIVLTYSRGAAVAVVLVAVFLALIRQVRWRHLALGAVAAVAAVSIMAPEFLERVGSIGDVDEVADTGGDADGALVGRATANLAAWHVFLEHPVVGVGPERFFHDHSQRAGNEVGLRFFETPRRAHNLYLEVAADLGVVGLVSFLGATVGTVVALDRRRRRCRERPDLAHLAAGYEAALVGYLTSGLFLHLAFQRYFWLLLALAAAAWWSIGRELEEASGALELVDDHPRPAEQGA